jgi:hypothetical protein
MAMHRSQDEIKTGGPSPELEANIFSFFTWQWMQPFINLGNKKTIQVQLEVRSYHYILDLSIK